MNYQDKGFQEQLLEFGSRKQIIDWLTWNDPNGCFSDKDAEAEGWEPMNRQQAAETMRRCLGGEYSNE